MKSGSNIRINRNSAQKGSGEEEAKVKLTTEQ